MNLSLLVVLSWVTSATLDLDPMGVHPLILNEGLVHGPLLARSPFVVQLQSGLLCVDDARGPDACITFDPDPRGLTVRPLGSEGLLVVRAPPAPSDDWRIRSSAGVVVLSARGIVFAADDVLDVHVHGDAVDVGLRCAPTIPAPARFTFCPVHQSGAQERFSVRVVNGALVRGEPRTLSAEDGTAVVPVRVDGHKTAFLSDTGLWTSRRQRGALMLEPDPDEIEDADSIEGPTHVDVCDAHLTARGLLRVTLTEDPEWSDHRANLDRWRAAAPRIVRGTSPATPILLGFAHLDVCPGDVSLIDNDVALADPRCGRTIRVNTYSSYASFHAGALWCALDVSDAGVQCADPGVTVTWTGANGSEDCDALFTGSCSTTERARP